MKLSTLSSQYVAYKQAMGDAVPHRTCTLQSFCRTMGDIAVGDMATDRVCAYLAGAGPVTRFWNRKYEVLRGFYRYAMASRTRNSSDCLTLAPIVKTRSASCSLTFAACSSCCCTEPHCASLRRFPSRWLMSICPPACSRFEQANSTRHGWSS
jgi:hypothetical protein